MTDDDWFERALEDNGEQAEGDGGDDEAEDEETGGAQTEAEAQDSPVVTGGDDEDDWFDGEDQPEEADSPFPGAAGGDRAAGGGVDGDAGAAFGDDGAPGGEFGDGDGGDFGMSEFDVAADSTDFDEEALDSDIDRVDLGITGLDEMIRGGVPESSLMAVIGSAGTGKTTFGIQFLEEGLAKGERGIYITLEEGRERILTSAEEKGWPYREYMEDDRVAVVDMDPIEMANSLSSIRGELPRLIDRFGASRLVLDSVSLLEMMYDDRATRRNEIYTFARSLKEAGVTVLLTSEADEDNPYASRHGIVEYLTDAVYILQYVRPSDFQETRLAVEIQKIRDAHHSREMKPYEITDEGLSVYRQANIF